MKIVTSFNQSVPKQVRVRTSDNWHKRIVSTGPGESDTFYIEPDHASLFIKNTGEATALLELFDYSNKVYSTNLSPGQGLVVPIDNTTVTFAPPARRSRRAGRSGRADYTIDVISIINLSTVSSDIEITTV